MGFDIALRPVEKADMAFLRALYASTRDDELALVDWDAAAKSAFVNAQFAAQQQYYQSTFPDAVHQVVECNGAPAGQVHFVEQPQAFLLIDIIIAPAYRNHAIGTYLLQRLMAAAAQAHKPLHTHVWEFNPRARRFYEHLGFVAVEHAGMHFLMQWPSGSKDS
jgi:GNAT superfamily N-acetyltransferase